MRVLIVPPTGNGIHPSDLSHMGKNIRKILWDNTNSDTPKELSEKGLAILTDSDGLKKGLEYNQNLYPFFYAGTAIIAAVDGDAYTGLTYNQLIFAQEWLERLKLLY